MSFTKDLLRIKQSHLDPHYNSSSLSTSEQENMRKIIPLIIDVVESISSITPKRQTPQITNDCPFILLIDQKQRFMTSFPLMTDGFMGFVVSDPHTHARTHTHTHTHVHRVYLLVIFKSNHFYCHQNQITFIVTSPQHKCLGE